jgi:predicted Zn-dependent protease
VAGHVKDLLKGPDKADEPSPPPAAPLPAGETTAPRPQPPAPGPADPSTSREGPASRRKADPIGRLFDLGHRASRVADEMGQEVLGLSWEEEQEVGRDVHGMIAREQTLSQPPDVVSRLEGLAGPILQQRTRQELVVRFYVVETPGINAFAHAGGYVYVNRGMLDFAGSDAVLQFILAHEIGHQELRHVVKRMTYAARASQLGGQAAGKLAEIAYHTIAIGYSKEQEYEADAWACHAMRRAGRSRDASLAAIRELLARVDERRAEPQRSEARDPLGKTVQ